MSIQKHSSLPVQLTNISLARLLLNIGLRMVYPFAPALGRGLGVELMAVYNLIRIRNFAGFFSPLFGPLSEHYGRRAVMIGALLFASAGSALVFLLPGYWPLGLTLVAISLGKMIYDPAMQAYVGDAVPYQQRGKAIAVTEISWSMALLVGGPAVGISIARWGWRAPFGWLAAAGLIAALVLQRTLPPAHRATILPAGFRETIRVLGRSKVVWAAAGYTCLSTAANENLFIVFGGWMEQGFGLALTSLGLASGVIGGAEIAGELAAGWSTDRFGKKPVVMLMGLLNAGLYILIPVTAVSLPMALLMLFLVFFTFETAVVGSVPLMTELVPHARSVVMSINVAAFSLGRTLGALIGPVVAERGGFLGNGVTAAVLMLMAVLILACCVRESSTPDA